MVLKFAAHITFQSIFIWSYFLKVLILSNNYDFSLLEVPRWL
jgi:hypothetical protein